MSFDVFLIPSSASPTGPAARAAVGRALAVCGARWGKDGEFDMVLASGAGLEFYEPDDDDAGGMFTLHGLDPEAMEVIFQVAEATCCFIIAPGEAPALLRTPGNAGDPPSGDEDAPIVRVADAEDLAARLSGDLSVALSDLLDEADEELPEIDPTLLDRFFKRPKKD
jgi:hypothetical protein